MCQNCRIVHFYEIQQQQCVTFLFSIDGYMWILIDRSVLLLVSILVDRIFYGDWILVQYNFLEFNVLHGGSAFYGSHPWHWYITQGYPVIMATHLIPFLIGGWYAKNKVLLMIIIWNIFIYR
jgi:phosphatidylinositol glycan class B